MNYSVRTFAALVLVMAAQGAPSAFALNPDVCLESGGTADCSGPVTTEYKYSYTSASWNGPHPFSSEQAAVSHFENNVANAYQACSTELHNPPWQSVSPAPAGGGVLIPDPHVNGGPNYTLSFYLSTETQQHKWEIRVTGTYATSSSPPCGNPLNSGYVQLIRSRTVECPAGYQPNYYTAPTYSYCWRYPSAEPATRKNLGPCTKDCDLSVGNPVNVATGNKYAQEVDYVGSGTFPLQYARRYNSLAYLGGTPVGPDFLVRSRNWSATYDRAVLFNEHPQFPAAEVYRHDGRVLRFKLTGGAFVPQADVNDRLVRQVDASGNTTGWTLTTEGDETETYDATGRLAAVSNRAGITHGIARDSQGRITTVTHSFGQQLSFAYDVYGRIDTLTAPGGAIYTFGYVATSAKLSSVTYPGGAVRSYHYEDSSYPYALTGITDESAVRFSTYIYDGSGKVSQTEHAGAVNRFSFAYPTSTATTVTDPLSTPRTWTHASILGSARASAISQVCPSCGSASKAKTFDANGNVATRLDFNDNETRYVYDLARNLETSRTEAYGTPRARTIGTSWHATFRLPDVITEPNRTIDHDYDANGNLTQRKVTDSATAATRIWAYTYDTYGRVLTENGPRTDVSDTTTYTYYSCTTGYQCGQLQTITNALSQVTTYNTYNAHGQPTQITDPNGIVTTLAYDARQRLTSRTTGGETTTYEYWPTGLLKKVTLPDSSFILNTYDAAHRLIKIEDGEGNRIQYTLDNAGNRTAENVYDPTSVLLRTRTRAFNSLSQLWKEIGAAGTAAVTTTFGYDANGNQTSIAAPLSRNTGQLYDELNRLKQITDPASGVTQFGYDANDNLTSVTDPRSLVTGYEYNGFRDLAELTSPDTGVTASTYDSGGNLATRTDARSKIGTYSYDALNRVSQIAYPDQTLSFTYDAGTNGKGHLTGASDANHSLAFTYDALGRVTGKSQTVGAVTKSVGYGYADGNLTSLVTPSGQTVAYSYSNGRIASVTLNGSTTILNQVLYEPFGPVAGWTWGNSTIAARVYDQDGKITDLDSAGASTYGYDDASRITGVTDLADSTKSWTHGYDALDRLNSASRTGLTIGYTYDANGNRLTQTGTQTAAYTVSGSNNRVSSITGTPVRTYTHDSAGNATAFGGLTFTYADSGRMSSVTSGSGTINYVLNALGQRVKKSGPAGTRLFWYDEAGHILGEYDGAGALVQETVWLGDIPVATLRPNGTGGVNVFYVHTDHLNTPRRISRPSDNAVLWRWDSDPFGTSAANEDPDGDSNLFAYHLRFPGQYFDAENGLHYNYYRDGYDPVVGRYTQSDPIGLVGGINTYAYVDGDPLTLADPTGLVPGPSAAAVQESRERKCAEDAFLRNYGDMKTAVKTQNLIGSDRYFHCKANCEAARCGKYGIAQACLISDIREGTDSYVKYPFLRLIGRPRMPNHQQAIQDSQLDQVANVHGRTHGVQQANQPCAVVCSPFRPSGLSSRY